MIELTPPESDNYSEGRIIRNFMCPRCQGSGQTADWGIKENKDIPCPRCAGTGRLRAKYTIEWEADV